ncbi:MAG: SLC13 family permease, partial [bacterium]
MQQNANEYSLRQKIGFFLTLPVFILFILLPAPAGLSQEGWRVFASAAVMAILWITECIPIPATALLPLILFPFFGVNAIANVAVNYANSNIFLFMGGFFIAMAMQKWGLHRRIALYLIYLIGSSPKRIVLGFMVATAFLSMWISNTATTMMMYPIGLAIILHLMERRGDKREKTDHTILYFRTALMLGIAYAASIGGIATLVGTPPNIVFVSAVTRLYPQAPEISFVSWLVAGLILVVLFLPICWLILTNIVFKVSKRALPGGKKVIRDEIDKLGPMQPAEKMVAIVFAFTAFAWITRRDLSIGDFTFHGWSSLLGVSQYVNDATVAIFAAFILFILPHHLQKGEFVLDWESAAKIPWGILILFGGGIALADGFKISGLAGWIGQQLSLFGAVPLIVMIVLTCATLTFMTELTSNVATTTLFMPILASTATAIHAHPFLLMIPATISASCAFMLPVATPPNAIIFASGYVTVPQMAKAGILLNCIGIVIVTLLTYFVVVHLFCI